MNTALGVEQTALKIGAVAVSVNAMLKSLELEYLLNDSGARLLCTAGELLANVKKDQSMPGACPGV